MLGGSSASANCHSYSAAARSRPPAQASVAEAALTACNGGTGQSQLLALASRHSCAPGAVGHAGDGAAGPPAGGPAAGAGAAQAARVAQGSASLAGGAGCALELVWGNKASAIGVRVRLGGDGRAAPNGARRLHVVRYKRPGGAAGASRRRPPAGDRAPRRGTRRAITCVVTLRQSREVSSTLALSTDVSLPRRPRASPAATRTTRAISSVV